MKRSALSAAMLSAVLLAAGCSSKAEEPIVGAANNTTIVQAQIPEAFTSAEAADTAGTAAQTTSESTEEGSGGNPGTATVIAVTVSENKYFYNNHEISYDELIKLFDGLDKTTAVKLSDENASKKAFEKVTKALEERGLLYEA